MRRILRIWPLYLLVIALGYLAGLHWAPIRIHHDIVVALALMYGNVFVAHHGWTHSGILNPLWSISVEEQFYIAIPLLVLRGGKRALSIVYLGKISYGLYLFHFALMWFVFSSIGRLSPASWADQHPGLAALLVMAATITLATLSYQLFEKPILRWKQRFEIEKTRI